MTLQRLSIILLPLFLQLWCHQFCLSAPFCILGLPYVDYLTCIQTCVIAYDLGQLGNVGTTQALQAQNSCRMQCQQQEAASCASSDCSTSSGDGGCPLLTITTATDIDATGVSFIQSWEALSFWFYYDSHKPPQLTIGYGFNCDAHGPDCDEYKTTGRISQTDADYLFAKSRKEIVDGVNTELSSSDYEGLVLTQNQYNGRCSLQLRPLS